LLRVCQQGYLLVNTTLDTQVCVCVFFFCHVDSFLGLHQVSEPNRKTQRVRMMYSKVF